MITILATIFVFGIVVLVHEWGHFITAKIFNMRVDEFAIGFGPTIVKKRKGETLYSIRAIPLGGYNKIAGMDPDEDCGERGFNKKPVLQRIIVIVAGAFMNFVLAFFIYYLVLVFSGVSVPSDGTVVGNTIPQGPAQIAHMQAGDKILSVNGSKVNKWQDILVALENTENQAIPIIVERNGNIENLTVIPKEEGKRAIIGIYPYMTKTKVDPVKAIGMSFSHTGSVMKSMYVGLQQMITGKVKGDIAGPIGVAHIAGQVAQQGWIPLLMLTALISINLGIINLLPIPVLDGGYLVMLVVEAITRRKVPTKAIFYIQIMGLLLLGIVFVYATYNDISRLL